MRVCEYVCVYIVFINHLMHQFVLELHTVNSNHTN